MKEQDYDFAGYVTKNDIRCSDGVIIRHGAFQSSEDKTVPLVWNHDHSDPTNVIGNIMLHNVDNGVYGYGHFNDSDAGKSAREMVKHGDISAMSIGANRIKRRGSDVVGGRIFEVSLVLAGANPGALIETVVNHSDEEGEEAIIYPGTLIHSSDDMKEEFAARVKTNKGGTSTVNKENDNQQAQDDVESKDLTVNDVLDTLTDDQETAVAMLVEEAVKEATGQDTPDEEAPDEEQTAPKDKEDDKVTHNIFDNKESNQTVLMHSELNGVLEQAKELGSWKAAVENSSDDIQHGINNIEVLYPEAKSLTNEPLIYKEQGTNAAKIVGAIRKSPFSRIKTVIADLTDDEARAKGYIKGNEKLEQMFPILHRETTPQTVYKKQKLDRDDVIDITDFDIVKFINNEMRVMLDEELARAVLIGDGRANDAEDKIQESHIRPVFTDDDMYTIKKTVPDVAGIIEGVIKGLAEYQGSGQPSLFISPLLLADLRLLKADDGRFLFGDIPTAESIAARLGVKEIVPTTFFNANQFVLLNWNDYSFGATQGGQVTTFDDFDIDFNQYKYLIETRLSGALTVPKSAIAFTISATEGPKA